MRSLPVLPLCAFGFHAVALAQTTPQPMSAPTPPTRVVTLAEAEQAALERQPQLLVAHAATSIAQAQADQARSPLLPQVTGTATYTRRTGNFAPGAIVGVNGTTAGMGSAATPPGWSLSQSFDVWTFGLAATQLIYDFGQTLQRYRSAATNAVAAGIAERTARLQVFYTVRRSYFNARAMKELVDVAHETLDDQQRHLVQVSGFVQVGTQPAIALAQQQASVANAQVQLITAQNNYETAKAQLNQAAGITGGTDYDVADDEGGRVEEEDLPTDVLFAKAIATRPEIATLLKQRVAQEETLSSAKGGYGPTLSASAGATEQGTALDGLVPNWSAGLILTWPIFQGGLTQGQVHQAEAGLQSIDAQRSLEELQVRLDVDSARLAVRAAKATIAAAGDAVTSAREQLRLAEQRYVTGVGNIIELTDAQVSYTAAEAQLVTARYGLATARAQLLAALGRP